MKLRKLALAFAMAGIVSGMAQAAPYVGDFNTGTVGDGVLISVTGFDIYSNGVAAFFCATPTGCNGGTVTFGTQLNPTATNQIATGDLVTTLYQGVVNVVNPAVQTPNLAFPGSSGGDTYQLTIAAIFTEFVVNAVAGAALLQPLDGGRVAMFYDTNAASFITTNADLLAGTGYTDGLRILDGTVSAATSPINLFSVAANGTAGGSATVGGLINFAEPYDGVTPTDVGFRPLPGDFLSTTTLQFGGIDTVYQTVNFFDNANGFVSTAVNSAFTIRADANVDLSALVPEPSSVALLALGLAGLGFSTRRRRAA